MTRFTLLLALCCCESIFARDASCPKPWKESQCLGSSGELAAGQAVEYKPDKIAWRAGMGGHSHYKIDPKKTALFVIDPQQVYAACPEKLDLPSLLKDPSDEDFDGHSPLCCEKFYPAVENANKIAAEARKAGIPVHTVAHVYRDLDDDKKVDNCGRLCDFDVLGWAKWPMAFNLWNAALPWSAMVYKDKKTPDGFDVDFEKDFYSEKTTFSAFTKPVVDKLKAQGVDTVILTGFMTQYCISTGARHAHDLGFRVIVVKDAIDGPKIQELLLNGVDENEVISLYLGVAVTDTVNTNRLVKALKGEGYGNGKNGNDKGKDKGKDDDDAEGKEKGETKKGKDDKAKSKLYSLHASGPKSPDWTTSNVVPIACAAVISSIVTLGVQRLVSYATSSRPSAGALMRQPEAATLME